MWGKVLTVAIAHFDVGDIIELNHDVLGSCAIGHYWLYVVRILVMNKNCSGIVERILLYLKKKSLKINMKEQTMLLLHSWY